MEKFTPKPGQIDYTHIERVPVINCVVEYEGKILLVKRSGEVRFYPGFWNGVSGFLDDGKNPAEKAKAEIFEELGIAAEHVLSVAAGGVFEIRDEDNRKTWITHPLHVRVDTDAVALDWEAEEYRWVAPSEAGDFTCIPGFIERIVSQFFPLSS